MSTPATDVPIANPAKSMLPLQANASVVVPRGAAAPRSTELHAMNGAIVVPFETAEKLPAACDVLMRREAVILEAARSEDFTIDRLKAAMAERNAIFGGEHSAHYYFRDFWGADTGMLAALHVLALAGRSDRPLSELSARFNRYAASGEINSKVDDPAAVIERVAAAYSSETQDRLDGLTVDLGDWWFNLRASNTEPLLRLNLEAPDAARCAHHVDEVRALIDAK